MLAGKVVSVAARLDGGGGYFGAWNSYEQLFESCGDLAGTKIFPSASEVIFASYGGASYEGDATVIFIRDGKIYENHDSHCSCNGLDSWAPEETTVAALAMRERKSLDGYGHFLNDHEDAAVEAYWKLVDLMVEIEKV